MTKNKIIILAILLLTVLVCVLVLFSVRNKETQNNFRETWGDKDLIAEAENLNKINVYPKNKDIDQKDYPKNLGSYYKNNLPLVEQYNCSDVCPDQGGVNIIFKDIKKADCEKIGGVILSDPAWGGYKGCEPAVINKNRK